MQTTSNQQMERRNFKDLWNQLPQISNYNKQSLEKLNSIKKLAIGYNKLVNKFGKDLSDLGSTFYQEMIVRHSKREQDSSTFVSTLSLAVGQVTDNINLLAQKLQKSDVMEDVLEPLEIFLQSFKQGTQQIIWQGEAFLHQYQESLAEVQMTKKISFDLNEDLEKLEMQIEQMNCQPEYEVQIEKLTLKSQKLQQQRDLAYQQYQKAHNFGNTLVGRFPTEYLPLLEYLQQQEESRISFISQALSKFVTAVHNSGKLFEELQPAKQFISSETDITLFVNQMNTQECLPQLMKLENYQVSEQLSRKKEAIAAQQVRDAFEAKQMQSDQQEISLVEKVKSILLNLMDSQNQETLRPSDAGFILDTAKLPEVRQEVALTFKDITQPIKLSNPKNMKTLGFILFGYLDSIEVREQNVEALALIESIMHISLLVGFGEGREKKILAQSIDQHKIWTNVEMWKYTLKRSIDQKIAIRKQELNVQQEEKKEEKGLMGRFTTFAKKLTKQDSQTDDNKQTDKILRSYQQAAYSRIVVYIKYFVNFRLSFEKSRELILKFCQDYDLEKSKVHILLGDLESLQIKQIYQMTSKDKYVQSLQKREKIQSQFGKYTVVGLCVRYVNSDQVLRNLLLLNKESHNNLRLVIYKQALIGSEPERLPFKRKFLWDCYLSLTKNQSAYLAFKKKVEDNPFLIEQIEEVIRLDVARSTESMPDVDKGVLLSILQTYAFFNPEIQYCQGMNYITGFLLQVFKEEEIAFKALHQLAVRQDFAKLFNKDLPQLKLYFMQLDRLVSLHEPALQEHLLSENIGSNFYASSWFITLFTNQLHSNTDAEGKVNETLAQLWDYFIVSGWKAIFLFNVYLVTHASGKLLELQFEELIQFFTNAPRQILLAEGYPPLTVAQKLKKEFKEIGVVFHLEKLRKDFEMIHKQ